MAAYAMRRPGKIASRWFDFGLGTAAVMLLLTAGIGALGTVRLFNSQADVDRVNETISGLEQLLSLAQDMETGQRGYILTGKPGYLQPYLDARPKIDRQLERVNTLLRDEAVQRQRLAKLRALLDQKQIELAHTIWLRRIEGLQAAQAVIGNDTGKALMDQARGIVSDMEATARNQLTVLHESARTTRDAAIMVGLVSGGLTWWATRSNSAARSAPWRSTWVPKRATTLGSSGFRTTVSESIRSISSASSSFFSACIRAAIIQGPGWGLPCANALSSTTAAGSGSVPSRAKALHSFSRCRGKSGNSIRRSDRLFRRSS